ncbi:MAG: SDR family NAD(P)-dependent oxidoreductase [Acidimicrobiales bacterium]
MNRLKDRVAIVTGASRGMGAATALRFVQEGARVIIADIRVEEGETLAKELGERARFVELDVADESAWTNALGAAEEFGPSVDILVNNAGIASFMPIAQMSVENYERVYQINQLGVFLGMRTVIPSMTRAGRGSIVNISSVDGLFGSPMAIAYGATKFAVTGMTKVAALELAPAGIRVNSVHPGVVRTPILEVAPGLDLGSMIEPTVPLHRVGEAEEVANLSLFLASDESSYITGAAMVIDGGATAGHVIQVPQDVFAASA